MSNLRRLEEWLKSKTRAGRGFQKLVGKTGFEPATPWSQTRCATGLRYFPIRHGGVSLPEMMDLLGPFRRGRCKCRYLKPNLVICPDYMQRIAFTMRLLPGFEGEYR